MRELNAHEIGCLDVDDLLDVLGAVESSLSANWKRFSTQLGIKTGSIEVIEHNHPRDAKACLYDALVDWLKMNYDHQRHGRPSWERLAKAVKSLDSALFEQIVKEHPNNYHALMYTNIMF